MGEEEKWKMSYGTTYLDEILAGPGRLVNGIYIPYLGDPIDKYFDAKFVEYIKEQDSYFLPVFRDPKLEYGGTQTIKRWEYEGIGQMLVGESDGLSFLSRFRIPGGQYKNMAVALWTIMQSKKKKIRVAIVGASAGYGSGKWLDILPYVLLMLGYEGIIECYDIGLEPYERAFQREQLMIGVTFYQQYYKGDGSEFDILIDDVFFAGQPGSTNWKTEIQSSKNFQADRPFFHRQEGRYFPNDVIPEWNGVSCPCNRCIFESYFPKIVQGWFTFVESSVCLRSDANAKQEMWAQISSFAVVIPITKVHERAVLAIKKTFPSTKIAQIGEERQDKESIVYVGVNPEEIGLVGLAVPAWGCTVGKVFAKEVPQVSAHKYYFPQNLEVVGFEATGKENSNYIEYKSLMEEKPGRKKLYIGKSNIVTDFWGRVGQTASCSEHRGNLDQTVMWCQSEGKVQRVPHNCSPLCQKKLDPNGSTVIYRGYLLAGYLEIMQGEYCPRCHIVEEDHQCGVIRTVCNKQNAQVKTEVAQLKKKKKKTRKKKSVAITDHTYELGGVECDPLQDYHTDLVNPKHLTEVLNSVRDLYPSPFSVEVDDEVYCPDMSKNDSLVL